MSDINLGIGPLVKKYRTIKGYSIRELARNINVTASMLSQIERDIVNPSINTLKAISVELGVPMYKFFVNDEDEQKPPVVRKGDHQLLGSQYVNVKYELLTPDVKGDIEFCKMLIPHQEKEDDYIFSHDGEEDCYVISGKTDVYIDGVKYTIESGDSLRIQPHVQHKWFNPYGETCELIFALTPPTF